MKKKILFIYRGGYQKHLFDAREKGKPIPLEFLWGYDGVDTNKYDLSYIIAPRADRRSLPGFLGFFIEFPFTKMVKLGLAVDVYPLFKKEIDRADIIFCVNDAIGFGLLFWKLFGRIKGDIYINFQSLSERLRYFKRATLIIWFIKKMLARATHIFTSSNIAHEPLIRIFNVDEKKISTYYFGVDLAFWQKEARIQKEDYIMSIGNDFNRDFKTVISAIPQEQELKVVTRRKLNTQEKKVTRFSDLPDIEVRTMYQKAKYVVVPSQRVIHEVSGISCSLQAMACGSAVLVSRAPSLEEFFTGDVDCFFYESENTEDLKRVINDLNLHPEKVAQVAENGYRKTMRLYGHQRMAHELMRIIDK